MLYLEANESNTTPSSIIWPWLSISNILYPSTLGHELNIIRTE